MVIKLTTGQLSSLASSARANLWNIEIPVVPGYPEGSNFILTQAKTSSLPGVGTESIEIPYKLEMIKEPGRITYPRTITITFNENINGDIYKMLYSWRQLVNNQETGEVGDPSLCKTEMFISPVNYKGEDIYKFKLLGVYIQELPDVAVSDDTNDVLRFEPTFSYDSWRLVDANNTPIQSGKVPSSSKSKQQLFGKVQQSITSLIG